MSDAVVERKKDALGAPKQIRRVTSSMERVEGRSEAAAQGMSDKEASRWDEFEVFFSYKQLEILAARFDEKDSSQEGAILKDIHFLSDSLVAAAPEVRPTLEGITIANPRKDFGQSHPKGTVGFSLTASTSPESSTMTFDEFVEFARHFIHMERQRRPRIVFVSRELDMIEEVYKKFDRELGDGTTEGLRTKQIFELWRQLPFGGDLEAVEEQHELVERIQAVDLDSSGTIDWEEFLLLVQQYRVDTYRQVRRAELQSIKATGYSRAEVYELRQVYSMIDTDGAGVISVQQMREIFKGLGLDMNSSRRAELQSLVERVIKQLDPSAEGMIPMDFCTFLHVMKALLDSNFAGIRETCDKLVGSGGAQNQAMKRVLRQ